MQKQNDQTKQPAVQPKPAATPALGAEQHFAEPPAMVSSRAIGDARPVDVAAMRLGHPLLGGEQLQRVAQHFGRNQGNQFLSRAVAQHRQRTLIQRQVADPKPMNEGVYTSVVSNKLAAPLTATNTTNPANKVDWVSLEAYLTKAWNTNETVKQSINPALKKDHQFVEGTRSTYMAELSHTFANEKAKIEQIVLNDNDTKSALRTIQRDSKLAKADLKLRNSALKKVEAGKRDMQSALNEEARLEKEAQQEDAAKKLTDVSSQKAKAMADVEAAASLLSGAIDFGMDVGKGAASGGPAGAAAAAGDYAKGVIISEAKQGVINAYKTFAAKDYAHYDSTIRRLQGEIATLKGSIMSLKHEKAANDMQAAALRIKSNMEDVKAFNIKIEAYAKSVSGARNDLVARIKEKYPKVASFKVAAKAEAAMKKPLADYRISLVEAQKTFTQYEGWQVEAAKLQRVSAEVTNTEWLLKDGGGKFDFDQPTKKSDSEKKHEERMRQFAAKLFPIIQWLNIDLGQWVTSQNQHHTAEIDNVDSGVYTDFIRDMDRQLFALLPENAAP